MYFAADEDGLDHADCARLALPCDVEGRPVVDARTEKGQAEREGDGPLEIEGLAGDVALVVVEREDGRVAPRLGEMEDRIGPDRPGDGDSARARLGDGGDYLAALLVAEEAVLAAMRIEARHDDFPDQAQARESRADNARDNRRDDPS